MPRKKEKIEKDLRMKYLSTVYLSLAKFYFNCCHLTSNHGRALQIAWASWKSKPFTITFFHHLTLQNFFFEGLQKENWMSQFSSGIDFRFPMPQNLRPFQILRINQKEEKQKSFHVLNVSCSVCTIINICFCIP